MTSDGTEGCCTDKCTGACGGYGFAFELAARNVRDGIEGARPIGTWIDEIDEVALSEEAERGYDVDKLVPRRLSACCGTTICGSGIVGMFSLGGDLSRRAKGHRSRDGI